MRILVVNEFHRQPGSGGSARLNELAAHWTARGHQVTVLSSTVDHASGRVRDAYRGRWLTRERSDGANVLRCWTLEVPKSAAATRIARDLSFAATSAIAGIVERERPDVVLASSPPLFDGLAGIALARDYNVPLVFEARDLWPDVAVAYGALRGTSARLAYWLEKRVYAASAHVVVVTPAFAERLVRGKGLPREKVSVIPNGVDASFEPGPADVQRRRALGWEGRFVVAYAGVHGPSQALGHVLDAAELLRDEPRALFALIGEGEEKPRLLRERERRGLDNVQMLPQVPREDVPHLLRAADVGLASLKALPAFRGTYPAKVFEIMGVGRPLLLSAEGAVAELVQEASGGLVVPPEDGKALAGAVRALLADAAGARAMGERGAAFVRARFERGALADEYLRVLERVVAR